MKKFLSFALSVLLLSALLTGCGEGGGKGDETPLAPEERTELYKNAIESARDQEMNEAVPVITSAEDDMADFILPMLGITAENTSSFAVAVSAMNVRAYGIAAVMPAAGEDEAVLEGLNSFIENPRQQYLADQYEVAKNARLETLEDGTLLLVMSEGQDALFDAIRDSIEKAG